MSPCLDCGDIIRSGSRCAECQRAMWRRNNARRDPLATAVYQSKAYRDARAVVLAGAMHCATCGGHVSQVGKLTAGHRVPIRDDPALAADPAGLVAQCRSCQQADVETQKRERVEEQRRKFESGAHRQPDPAFRER